MVYRGNLGISTPKATLRWGGWRTWPCITAAGAHSVTQLGLLACYLKCKLNFGGVRLVREGLAPLLSFKISEDWSIHQVPILESCQNASGSNVLQRYTRGGPSLLTMQSLTSQHN